MMNEDEIKSMLMRKGCPARLVPQVLSEVAQLACGRALAAYVQRIPETDKARVLAITPETLPEFLKDNAGKLPPFSQEEFDTILDQTWKEYFASLDSHT